MAVHAFIFPGQGSQAVGMGRDLAAAFAPAREVFQEVDETLKQNLSKLMFEGPAEELMLTANALPEHVEAGRQAGADRHLSKPVSVQALLDCVRELTAPGAAAAVAASRAA